MKRRPNPATVYLRSLSESGARTQRQALRKVLELLGDNTPVERFHWERLRFEDVARVREIVAERYRPATANRILAALRATLRTAWRLGLMRGEPFRRAVDVANVRGSRLPRGRAPEPDELGEALKACDNGTPAGLRDGALVALLAAGGLRRGEAVSLQLDAVDLVTGAVTVAGKGRRQRRAYVGDAVAWLRAWAEVRGGEPGPFLGEVRGGRVVLRELSAGAAYMIVRARAAAAGLRKTSPHDLRRGFATQLLDAGVDLEVVSRLLGHASLVTTTIYDRRGEAAKQAAQRRLVLPGPHPVDRKERACSTRA